MTPWSDDRWRDSYDEWKLRSPDDDDEDACPYCGGGGFVFECFDGSCEDADVGCASCTHQCQHCTHEQHNAHVLAFLDSLF